MLKIFNTNKPIVLFFLPLMALLFHMPHFFQLSLPEMNGEMPLFRLFGGMLVSWFWSIAIYFVTLLVGAYLLNFVVNKHNLLFRNTNLAATIYLLLMGLLSFKMNIHPVLFANIFLIAALDSTLTMYKQTKVYSLCFQVGLLIGLASHFFMPSSVFLLEFFIALIIIRTFDWRDWVITLFGFILPFLYSWSYYFWNDSIQEYYQMILNFGAHKQVELMAQTAVQIKVAVVLLILLGIWSGFKKLSKENVRQKNLLNLILSYAAISILIGTLLPSGMFQGSLLLMVPLTVLISIFFQGIRRKWLAELLFDILIVVVLSNIFFLF